MNVIVAEVTSHSTLKSFMNEKLLLLYDCVVEPLAYTVLPPIVLPLSPSIMVLSKPLVFVVIPVAVTWFELRPLIPVMFLEFAA